MAGQRKLTEESINEQKKTINFKILANGNSCFRKN